MFIVIGSHSDKIYSIAYDRSSPSRSLRLIHSATLGMETSWLAASPTRRGLLYVNSRDSNKLFAVQLQSTGELELLDSTDCGGVGPTHFVVDGDALVVVNVSLFPPSEG